MKYYLVIILMTIIGSVASFSLKKASESKSILKLITNKYFILGGILYFFAALMNIKILKYLDYSVVLPMTSITYIWTMILSYFILKEKITQKKVIGIVCIIIGTVFISL